MVATPVALAWMSTDWPGVSGKDGVSSIVTTGGIGAVATTRRTLPSTESVPSLKVKLTTCSPTW